MNNLTDTYMHAPCGSNDISFSYFDKLYQCNKCHELIFDENELLATVEVNNRKVVTLSQEAR
jgi:hypothetical protein